jgi:hypothetical protein
MEVSEKKDTSYYTAKDILVGEIIFILGRR